MANALVSETRKPRLGLRIFAVPVAVVKMSEVGALWHNEGWVYYIIVGIPGIWSLINVTLTFIKRPVHVDVQIAVDLIFTANLWFFESLSLIGETASYYDGYREDSGREIVVAALPFIVVNG
ncbi:hypothetical protein MYU51_019531 [Penicillium brevicompactum]